MIFQSFQNRINTSLATVRGSLALAVAIAVTLAPGVLRAQRVPAEPRQDKASGADITRQTFVDAGTRVTLTIESLVSGRKAGDFREGDDVRFRVAITDTLSGNGISGAQPAAWMLPAELSANGTDAVHEQKPTSCVEKVASCLNASVLHRPELDLNVFYVLVMNEDASVTVVDPLFSYGSSNLLAIIQLESPAIDWVATGRGERIYISMPAARKVAVVNTNSWHVEKNIAIPGTPGRIVLQPDGGNLWVGYSDSAKGSAGSGVAVIGVADEKLLAAIPTGAGAHQIAVADDSRFAYVTNGDDASVSVIDAAKLHKVADVALGGTPYAISYSPIAGAAYISDSARGIVTAIDGRSHRVAARVQAGVGITQLRFAPGGRLAFIVNPSHDRVAILDAAVNRIVQTAKVDPWPTGIFFSDRLAYVCHAKSESVLMIPLDHIGGEGDAVPVVDFPGGQLPAGRCNTPALADAIVKAPEQGVVLVANPLDKTVYYYMEGMAAPKGEFSNYGHEARAVMVVDRSLRQTQPGVYETVARLPRGGRYDIPFLLDAPRIVHCFALDVTPNDSAALQRAETQIGTLAVEHLTKGSVVPVGAEFTLRFRLTDLTTGKPVTGASDVSLACVLAPGQWRQDYHATETSEPGVYSITTTFASTGAYYLYATCPSRGLQVDNPQFRVITAVDLALSQKQKEEH